MTELSFGKYLINTKNLQEGLRIDESNQFLKKYDIDNNSIFSREEIETLKRDLEQAAGDDKIMQEDEALRLFAAKLSISVEEAKQKFAGAGKSVIDSIVDLNHQNEAKKIVGTMHGLIEDNLEWASVDNKDFQTALKQMNAGNVVHVLNEYKKASKGESLAEAILNEQSASTEGRKSAIQKIFNLLLENIDSKKYDTTEVKREFNQCMNNPRIFAERKNFDKVFDTMIQMIEGSKTEAATNLDSATENAKSNNESAKTTVDGQAARQGVVSRAIDRINEACGQMSEKELREIIAQHEKDLAALEALKGDYKAYCAKFKEIFGVEYSKEAVAHFDKVNAKYKEALKHYQTEVYFNEMFKEELENPTMDKRATIWSTKNKQVQAKEAFEQVYSKLCKMFGQEHIDFTLKESGVADKGYAEKYDVLCKLVKEISTMNHKTTMTATGGKEFAEVEKERTAAFNAAYGFKKNNLLKAQDWVEGQQRDLNTVMVGANILAVAGAMFTGGGTLALLSMGVVLTDPVGFAERATDANGMTKEDWMVFGQERLETLGWTCLGMGVGKVAQMTSSYVKLKGLQHVLKQGGKSLDDLKGNPNLPADILAKIKTVESLATKLNISTEVALDISTVALLQKDGVTKGDWVMSLAGALVGSRMQANLKNMPEAQQISTIRATFAEFDLSVADIKKMLAAINDSKFVEHVKKAKDKVQEWGFFTPSDNNYKGVLNSGINPGQVVQGVKKVVSKIADSLAYKRNSYLKDDELLAIDGLRANNAKLADATQEAMESIAEALCKNKLVNKYVFEDMVAEVATKHGVDATELGNTVKDFAKQFAHWKDVAPCFELTGVGFKREYKDKLFNFEMRRTSIKKENAKKPTAPPKKVVEADTKSVSDTKSILKTDELQAIEKIRVEHPDKADAVKKSLELMAEDICEGRTPSNKRLDVIVANVADEFDIDEDVLKELVRDTIDELPAWKNFAEFYDLTPTQARGIQGDYADDFAKFKASRNGEEAVEAPKTEPKQEPVKAEQPKQEAPVVKTEEAKAPEKTEQPKTEEAPAPAKEKFKVTDEMYEKYPEVAETAFFDYDTRSKLYQILEEYPEKMKSMGEFDSQTLYQIIGEYGVHDADLDRVFDIVKKRYHADVIAKETRIKDIHNKYHIDEDLIDRADKAKEEIRTKMENDEPITLEQIEEMLEKDGGLYTNEVEKCMKYIFDDPSINEYLNKHTHYDILTNPKYTSRFYEPELKEALQIVDRIAADVAGGQELTESMIENYLLTYNQEYGTRGALYALLEDHAILGPMFKELML